MDFEAAKNHDGRETLQTNNNMKAKRTDHATKRRRIMNYRAKDEVLCGTAHYRPGLNTCCRKAEKATLQIFQSQGVKSGQKRAQPTASKNIINARPWAPKGAN